MQRVLMVAAENGSLVNGKVGGIGDVIRDVPKYLVKQDVNVDVILPSYGFLAENNRGEVECVLDVPFCGLYETVKLLRLVDQSTASCSQWLLDNPSFVCASRNGIYCDQDDQGPFAFDAAKFALFCSAVCTLIRDYWRERIDVIHLHDWHAALVAVIREFDPAYRILKNYQCVYTIHNLAIQGIRPFAGTVSAFNTWFPNLSYTKENILDPVYQECFNPVRAAINFSDKVHAVSPNYAREITKASDYSRGYYGGENLHLDLQRAKAEKRLVGILNGCEYWSTEPKDAKSWQMFCQRAEAELYKWMSLNREVLSSHHIAAKRLENWSSNSQSTPLITSIGRLTSQKFALLLNSTPQGVPLARILDVLAECNGRIVVIGSGEPNIENELCRLMGQFDNLLFLNGYSELLPKYLYYLGDLFLMPSSFEPCGISQMLAMREGQPCLVHQIGGLADTVEHFETGFCFSGSNADEQSDNLVNLFAEVLAVYKTNNKLWQQVGLNAKSRQFSWSTSVLRYIDELY